MAKSAFYHFGRPFLDEKTFVDSLYPPETAKKLERLSELAGKMVAGEITAVERREHDALMKELSAVNPWLNNLIALSQIR